MIDKFMAILAFIGLVLIVGAIGYNELFNKNYTALVQLKIEQDPYTVIPMTVPSDSVIKEIKKVSENGNLYKVTFDSKRRKNGLIRFFSNNVVVENIRLIED